MKAFASLKSVEWKPVALGMAALVGFCLWWQLFLVPQNARLRDVRSKAGAMAKNVSVLKQKLAKLPEMQRNLDEMAGRYDAKMVTMLPEEQLPEIFQMISEAARPSDVQITSVKTAVEVSALSPSASGFLEVPIEVIATGGYHSLGRFIDGLEGSRALLRVYQIEIEANPADLWHHRATVMLRAYIFPGPERAKP